MVKLKLVAKLIEFFGKVDALKILSYGGTLLSIIAGLMTHSSQEKVMNKTIKEEVEKAVKQYLEGNGGVQ